MRQTAHNHAPILHTDMSLRMDAGFQHLKDAIAAVFARDVEFPVGVFVTVLEAKITANSAHAKVTLSVMPESRQKDVLQTLASYQREIKEGLAKQIRLRRIPRLHYVFDTTEAKAAIIEETLNKLKDAGDL